jgi:uncharacterized protein (DUF58 family)
MTVPTTRAVYLAALGVPLALLALFGGFALWLVAGYDLLLLVLALGDRALCADPRALAIRRRLAGRCVQGRSLDVALELSWRGAGPGRVLLREMAPVSFSANRQRFRLLLRPRSRTRVRYRTVPRRRGADAFGPFAVRTFGPLGLIARQQVRPPDPGADRVRVYPDLVSLSAREAALVAPSPWLRGARRGRTRGEGREFHQLRPYAAGDDVRQMDWKAYARRGTPVVREYRAERNQRVMLLLDAGRLMTVQSGDRLRFDWAVQAAGRLARVALAMGDLVGAATFSREVTAQVTPSRGSGHLARLADLLCDARPDLDEPDLGLALRSLMRRNTRRSLVVLFSEIADPRAAEQTVSHVAALSRRHLVLVVTLADVELDAARHRPVRTAADAFRRAAAEEVWLESRRTANALEAHGALLVRARADELAAEAVERYVEIKSLGRL